MKLQHHLNLMTGDNTIENLDQTFYSSSNIHYIHSGGISIQSIEPILQVCKLWHDGHR
ncbi:hypothetical protein MNQ98_10230 [Paenibacillus sp. N3/727]|uniref:hypothetical protein n=1 Tax=Paenibacillus sp. N3/727 TaxID=2925845 RepID=UPI001F5337D4|nr:hypothetical protein [Paenibacillus sp. N3/727]UNK20356.1 hypothetical protein MNQ98_10230 [Paenibacillus sp. N3/727]